MGRASRSRFPFGKFIERFGSKTIKKLRVDIFHQSDHVADDGEGFAGCVGCRAHSPEAVQNDAGDSVHHGGESGDRKNIAGDFDGAFFSGAFDFLQALGMGHGADVPDIEKDFAGLWEEERGEFAVIRPGAGDGAFIDGAGFGVEEKRERGNVGVRAIHADVALRLLFGIVEGMSVEERPDELAADVFQAEFEMRVLVDGVVAAEKSRGADVEALFVVYFFWIDEARGVAGARGGDSGVEGMREGVAEGDVWRSGLDEFVGISGLKHAGLGGHVGEAFYTEAEFGAGEREEGIYHRVTEEQRKSGKRE
jgi:hypothetical protein